MSEKDTKSNESSLEDTEDGTSDTDMTTVNAAVSEVPCIRIPLQNAYVSPTSPETAIIMYSSNTDNQGNAELNLRDTTNEINEKAFTSVFGRLESDQDSYTISYQDDSGPVLHQNNIDILLGAAALQSNENSVNNFDIFETDTKESELILSPKSFGNGSENGGETNNSQQNVNEEIAVTEDVKSYPDGKSPSSGKKIKPKASSPNGWGPQQCSICSKVFGNTSALAKHKLTHSDERKYVCVTCGKAFKRQDHLNGHMLTHRHKKPFECKADGCGKSYCDARSLRRHTENHHLHPSLPIAPPTISVQEVISSTSNIPTCIHYAPKGTQSFQKSNNSTSKVPKMASNEKSIILKTVTQPSSESGDDKTNSTNATIIHCKNSRSNNNNDCLTQEQLHLIEHIVNEQRKKLKCEKGAKQLKLVTHQQSTGSDGALDSRNMLVNSTVKITSTSVLVHNNKIKLLLQKGNIQTTNVNGTTNNANKQVSKSTIDVKASEQKPECKPVECNLCHRKFKNVPALNGHMRLHGGYFKKENDAKKWEKKDSNAPQLTTASISVRALIEEKIIQKRSNSSLNNASKLNLNNNGTKAKILKTSEILSKAKLNSVTVKEEESGDDTMINEYQPKVSSFAIPAAPSQSTTLSSLGANELLGKNKEENDNYNTSIHEETLMFNELLLKRVHQKPVKRASSDPGTMSHNTQSPQLEMTFSPENAYLDVYHNQNGQYFTNGIGDDMFQNVQDTNSMLLHNVDGSGDLNNLQQIENADFQEINLEEYETVTNDLQHQQDLQAVLNSPLPVSLAEFPYMQNETVITNHDQNTMPYSQSPLPSPGFTYPTPPASQEGQSPSFCHVSSVVHHTHVSSPLSSAFYSSGMSSPGAVEAALNEVLPMDVNQNVYPSPSSPSPLSVTPEPSPVSLSASTFNSQTDLYHSQSQDDDSLLTANQKDFVFRNNGDDEAYKFIDGDSMYQDGSNHEYQNVILNCNRLIDSGSQYVPSSGANSISLDAECGGRNITLQTEGRENITLYADDGADTRCNITFAADDTIDGEVHTKNARTISFSSSFDDSNNDINFNSTANDMNFQSENRGDISFYDKNLTFQMEDKDVAMYEGRENITLHSESQGHVVLHSDDRGNVIIQSDERNLNFHTEENNNYEHITFSPISHVDSHNITLHIADDDYEQKLVFAPSAKENQETFVIKSLPNSRKRPLNAAFRSKFPQKSRLRVHRHSSQMLHYTPCPMLNPLRNSAGLYWQAAVNNNSSLQKETGKEVPKNQLLIESDEEPHINIGPHFQANVEPCRENPHPGKIVSHEDLVWEPAIKHGIMDNELDMYLEFACCAALPGGGRNKEYALHVLHLCQGNIHEAVLKLMQPKLHVPVDHPLLTNDYCESEPWSAEEIATFQQAVFKFDKNFPRIAQRVGTKTAKQCTQFYYLWKKACPDEYKRSRLNWRHIREMDFEKAAIAPVSNVNVTNEVEVVATTTDTRPFACEYPECLARFNSRAALNGHNRIHGGSVDRWRTVTPAPLTSGTSSTGGSENLEEFPCKLCGKVFSKIKSRSAHMKSHRPSEMEPKKSKIEKQEIQKFDPPDTNSNRQSSSPLF